MNERVRTWLSDRELGQALAWGTVVAIPAFAVSSGFARTVLLCAAPAMVLAAILWSRTSLLLVGSFVFGVFGLAAWEAWNTFPILLLLLPLPGVIMGWRALVWIRRWPRVRPYVALAAIVFCSAHIVGYAYVALVKLPDDLRRPAECPRWQYCRCKLNDLARALALYAKEHDGRLPEATAWCDAIGPHVAGLGVFQCPQETYARTAYRVLGLPIYTYTRPTCSQSTYGFNKHVSGARLEELPLQTVLLFDCADSWNFAGSSADVKFRHEDRAYVLFADSHCECLGREALDESLFVVPSLERSEKP